MFDIIINISLLPAAYLLQQLAAASAQVLGFTSALGVNHGRQTESFHLSKENAYPSSRQTLGEFLQKEKTREHKALAAQLLL